MAFRLDVMEDDVSPSFMLLFDDDDWLRVVVEFVVNWSLVCSCALIGFGCCCHDGL